MLGRIFNNRIKFLLLGFFAVLLPIYVYTNAVAHAQPNPEINYQGKLTDTTGVAVENDNYNLRFYLYDTVGAATTSAIWTEEWLVSASNGVPIQNGLFSVMLGSTTALSSVDFNQTLYLGVEIGSTTTVPTWDGEMSPRKRLGTVPSAFEAEQLGGLGTSSFLRSDQADTLEASSASTLLTLIQNGAGAILSTLNSSAETVFSVFDSGIVTVGTSTDANIATSTGLAVYNKDVEIIIGTSTGLTKVGQIDNGDNAEDVVVIGGIAYLANNLGGLELIDISDPTNPVLLGEHDDGGGAAGLAVSGNYVYVADGGDGLEIVDVSDPTNPVEVGSFDDTSAPAREVAVSGDYAYVAFNSAGLKIVNVSDPTAPFKVGEFSDGGGGFAEGVAVVGSYVYLADGTGGFEIVDVSDPTNPFEVGGAADGERAYDVYVNGTIAYVADYIDGLEIFDISDPANPIEIAELYDGGVAYGVWVAGNYAFIADGSDGLEVIDISSSTNPVEVAQFDDGGDANGVIVDGNYVYLADDTDGLEIFDLGGLITPTAEIGNLLANDIESDFVRVSQSLTADGSLNVGTNAMIGGSLTITGTASSSLQAGNTNPALTIMSGYVGIGTTSPYAALSIDGDLALTGGLYDGLASLGVSGYVLQSTGTGLEWVATSSLGILGGSLFTDSGDITYLTSLTDVLAIGTSTNIATSTGLAVYNRDIEILAEDPVLVGTLVNGGLHYGISVTQNYAYIAKSTGLEIIDISDSANPALVGNYNDGSGTTYGVELSGNYVYLADGVDGIEVLDISDPTNPIEVGAYDDGGEASNIFVSGSYAYVADWTDGLEIMDISDPTNPVEVGSYYDGGNAVVVTVRGNYAYVADDTDGLEIIDISDPADPVEVGSFDDGGNAYSVVLDGNYAYVADRGDGLEIIDISDPSNPAQVGQVFDGGSANNLVVQGNYAYVADRTDGIEIFNIASSTNPFEVGSYDDGGEGRGIAVLGNYLYVADYNDGLEIYDLGGLITPTAEIGNLLANDIESDYLRVTQALVSDGSLNVGTNAMIGGTLTVVGNASSSLQGQTGAPALAVTSGSVAIGTTTDIATSTGLAVYNKDVEILQGLPTFVASTSNPSTAVDTIVDGDYLYVANNSGGFNQLVTYDISNPENINQVSIYGDDGGWAWRSIAKAGNYVYGGTAEQYISVVDVSDVSNPVEIDALFVDDTPGELIVNGNYLYAVTPSLSGGVRIIDISDPTNLVEVGYDGLFNAHRGALQGNYLYVTDQDTAGEDLYVMDVSDPSNPIQVSEINDGEDRDAILASGNRLYVATEDTPAVLQIYDTSDPITLTLIGTTSINSSGQDMALAGKYLFIGNASSTGDNLQVYDISSSTNPSEIASLRVAPEEANDLDALAIQGGYLYATDGTIEVYSLASFITPTAEIGNLLANDIQSDFVRVSQSLTTDGSLNVGTNAMIGGSLTITGTASSSLQGSNTNPALTITSGYVGIGTTSPYADLSVDGDIALTGALYDSTAGAGSNGDILLSTGTGLAWTATSTLDSKFTDAGDITYLTSLTDVLAIGTTTDIATSTGLAVYNRDIEILAGTPTFVASTSAQKTIDSFVIDGDLLYTANRSSSPAMTIVDISNTNNPNTLSTFIPSNGRSVQSIEKFGNYVVLGSGNADLVVVDVSNPSNPTEVQVYQMPNAFSSAGNTDMMVQGNYLYVVSEFGGKELNVVDISDPTNVRMVDQVDLANMTGFDIVGNFLFAVDTDTTGDDIFVYDVSDPTNIIQIEAINSRSWGAIDVVDSLMYIGSDDVSDTGLLTIYDVSDPAALSFVSSTTVNDQVQSVHIVGDYAYVGTATTTAQNVQIFNISSSTNVYEVGGVTANPETGAAVKYLETHGNYLYVGADDNLEIYDLGGLITPTAEIGNLLANDIETDYLRVTQSLISDGSLNVGTNAMIGGTLTVVGNASSSLQGQTGAPALAVTSGSVAIGTTTDIATSTGLAVYNKDVEIVIGAGGLRGIGSIADETNGADILNTAAGIAVVGDYAYVTAAADNGVQVLDISDPTNPIGVGSITDGSNGADELLRPRGIEVSGNYAYIAGRFDNGVQILDVSDPSNPVGVGSITDGTNGADRLGGAVGLVVQGDYAYISSGTDGAMQVLNISDPTNPIGVSSLDLGSAWEIEVAGNYAYVTSGNALRIIDISDPTNPFQVGIISDGTNGAEELAGALDVAISGKFAYVTGWSDNGFQIIDISDPANPIGVGHIADDTDGATNLGSPEEIAIVGTYAFVTSTGDGGVQVIDISSSTNPVGVGAINDNENGADELSASVGIDISGNYIYVAGWDDNGVQILDLGGLITPTAEIGNLLANDISTDFMRVTQSLTTDGSLNVGTNALIGGNLTITGIASSSLQAGNTNAALTITSGYVGIGTTTPYAELAVEGGVAVTGRLYDSTAGAGSNGDVLLSTGTGLAWTATTTLGASLFTDGGDITYLTSLTDVLAIGTSTDIATSTGLAVYNRDVEILAGEPTLVGTWKPNNTSIIEEPRDLTVVGDYAYVPGKLSDSVAVVDISDKNNPVTVSTWTLCCNQLNDPLQVTVEGNYIYVAQFDHDSVTIGDISNPTNPIQVDTWQPGAAILDGARYVHVSGNYMYVAGFVSDNLVIADISDRNNPQVVGEWSTIILGEMNGARAVQVVGNYAYMTGQNSNNLVILDVSDPTNPFLVSNFSPGTATLQGPREVKVHGNYAYITGEVSGNVVVVDISDPTTPTLVGNWDLDTAAIMDGTEDISIVGNYAYVTGNNSNNVVVLDISDPANPAMVADWDPNDSSIIATSTNLAISGNYAYVTDQGGDSMVILDLGGLITPTAEIGNLLANDISTDYLRVTQALVSDGSLNVGTNAMIGGTLTVVGNASSSLQGQTGAPALAVTSGSVAIGTTTDIATSTGLAVYNRDIEILVGGPVGVDSLNNGVSGMVLDGSRGIELANGYAYVAADSENGMQIIDISDPTNLVGLGNITDGTNGADTLNGPYDIAVSGNYAYVTADNDDGVQVIDISNPSNPIGVASITDGQKGADLLDAPKGIAVSGNYAYVASLRDNGLQIIDISDPTNPIGIGSIEHGQNGAVELHGSVDVVVRGNYAYVSGFNGNGIQVIDINDPTNPIGVGAISDGGNGADALNGGKGLAIRGNYLYVAAELEDGFQIIDISDPANPVGVGSVFDDTNGVTGLGDPINVAVAGNYAYVTSLETDEVSVIDISSSTNPVGAGSIGHNQNGADTLNGAWGIAILGNYAYVTATNNDAGVQVLDLGGLITPTAEIGNLLAGDIQSDFVQVTQSLTTDGSLNVGGNSLIGGSLTITGTASSSLQAGNTNPALTIMSGYMGIGTTSPYADLAVDGDMELTGRLYDNTASAGANGEILLSTGTGIAWTATSTLGGTGLFTDAGDITYLTSLTDILTIGTSTGTIATSTGLAVYNRDVEILAGSPVGVGSIADGSNGATELSGPYGVTVAGEYAYVAGTNDNGIQILDISDPTNPRGLGAITDDSNGADALGGASWIAVEGNYAYIASGVDDALQILDISDPTNPIGVGSITDGENGATEMLNAEGVAVAGNYAYVVSHEDDGMQVIDVSDPTNPIGVGSITDGANGADELDGAWGIALAGNYAYVVSYVDNGLQIIDISDPTNPIGVGSITDGANGANVLAGAQGIAVSGNYAYVGSYADNGLQIIDISDPTSPIGVGSITDGNNGADELDDAGVVTVAGHYAYVTAWIDDGVQIIDISSSTNPVGVGSITNDANGADTLNGAYGIAVSGNYAYVTGHFDNGVQVLDLGGLITPTAEIGNLLANDISTDYMRVSQSLTTDGSLNVGTNALIGGSLTVVGNASSSLLGDAAPDVPALAVTSGAVAIGTTTDIATSTGLAVYNKDVEILPGDPVGVGSITDGNNGADTLASSSDITIVGNYAYVTSPEDNGVQILDISDPANPVGVSSITDGNKGADALATSSAIAISGNYAYVASFGDLAVQVLDISDPTNPVGVGSSTPLGSLLGGPNDIVVVGNKAYVVSFTNFPGFGDIYGIIQVLDISDPTILPVDAAALPPDGPGVPPDFTNIAVNNNYAYVTSRSSNSVRVFSNSGVPPQDDRFIDEIIQVGSSTDGFNGADTLNQPYDIAVAGNYAYVTSIGDNGVQILDISDPMNPVGVGSITDGTKGADTLQNPRGITISGNYAFVTSIGDNGVQILDISSSTNPIGVGSITDGTGGADTLAEAYDIAIAGNYAYVTSIGDDGVQVLDLGGLITPTAEIGNLLANDIETDFMRVSQSLTTDGSLNVGTNAMVGGSLTITGTASSSLQASSTNPALTILSGRMGIGTTSPYADLAIDGNMALSGGLYDTNASLGTAGQILQSTGSGVEWTILGSLIPDIFTDAGDITYLTSLTDVLAIGTSTNIATSTGLAVYNRDIEILPGDPTKVGGAEAASFAHDVTVAGNYAYVVSSATGDDLEIFDISDPTNPTKVGGAEAASNAYGVTVAGNYAYVVSFPPGDDLEIFDISDPTNPTKVGGAEAASTARGVTVAGNYAYVVTASLGDDLEIFDISDPTNPTKVGGAEAADDANGVIVAGNYAYAVSDSTGDDLEIFDISDPQNPTKVGGADANGVAPRDAYGVTVAGNYAYVVTGYLGNGGLEIFDISDPTNPTKVGGAEAASTARGVTVAGNYAYVVTASTGTDDDLEIFDISSSTNPTKVGGAEAASGANGVTVSGNYAYVVSNSDGDDLEIFDLGGLITPTAEIGNLVSNDIETNFLRVTQSLISDSLNVNTNGMIGGALTITGTASSTLIDSNGRTALRITSGFIEIGTTTATSGIQIGYGAICVDNDGECSATTTGRISSVSSYTGNSDLAENYFSSDDLEPGEIVQLVGQLSVARATKNPTTPVQSAPLTESDDSVLHGASILGVVSTKPGLLLGFDDTPTRAGEAQYPIALKGRVPVKVSTENGAINPGDQLMLSSISGTAMKAKGTGEVIGIALEAFAPESDTDPYYSDTFINQYLDNLSATDDKDAIEAELKATPVQSATLTESNDSVLPGASTETDATEVKQGQIIMFVDLSYRYVDEQTSLALTELMGTPGQSAALTASDDAVLPGAGEDETLFDRLGELARNFIDGILSVFSLEAQRLEVTDELCINGTCIQADELRVLIERAENGEQITVYEEDGNDDISFDMGDTATDMSVGTTSSSTMSSTTPETSSTTTNTAENGDNSATSSEEIGDNGGTAPVHSAPLTAPDGAVVNGAGNTTTAGGTLVTNESASTTNEQAVEPSNDETVQPETVETPVQEDTTETPEASASADSDVVEETAPESEESEPEPEPVEAVDTPTDADTSEPASDEVNQQTS